MSLDLVLRGICCEKLSPKKRRKKGLLTMDPGCDEVSVRSVNSHNSWPTAELLAVTKLLAEWEPLQLFGQRFLGCRRGFDAGSACDDTSRC